MARRFLTTLGALLALAAPAAADPIPEGPDADDLPKTFGAPAEPHPATTVFNLIMKRRQLAGSLIGGIPETQEMLDFCAQHGIVSEIEIIPIQKINEAYERMLKSDVKYRFVIDMASLKQDAAA